MLQLIYGHVDTKPSGPSAAAPEAKYRGDTRPPCGGGQVRRKLSYCDPESTTLSNSTPTEPASVWIKAQPFSFLFFKYEFHIQINRIYIFNRHTQDAEKQSRPGIRALNTFCFRNVGIRSDIIVGLFLFKLNDPAYHHKDSVCLPVCFLW